LITADLYSLLSEQHQHQCKRDIVDTVPYAGAVSPEWLIKALLGAINRRIDSRAL
jgi:hypothetical protein